MSTRVLFFMKNFYIASHSEGSEKKTLQFSVNSVTPVALC